MKKISLSIILMVICFAGNALFGQDITEVNSKIRIFRKSNLADPANNSFNRPGNTLPLVLVNAVIEGDLETYKMINFAEIKPVNFQQSDNRLIIQREQEQLSWTDEWDSGLEYYFDDEVYYGGVIYRCKQTIPGSVRMQELIAGRFLLLLCLILI